MLTWGLLSSLGEPAYDGAALKDAKSEWRRCKRGKDAEPSEVLASSRLQAFSFFKNMECFMNLHVTLCKDHANLLCIVPIVFDLFIFVSLQF